MRLLIIGAPGAGKGTQASRIAEHVGVPAISTGAIFRQAIAEGTELGRLAKSIMDAGNLVPDDVTDAIVARELGSEALSHGWLLDGYPRNLHQVEALDAMLGADQHQLDAVILLDVNPELLVQRLLNRAELEGRSDDNEETIRRRMEVYTNETAPLVKAYRERGLLLDIDGEGSVDEVSERVFAALDSIAKNQA